MVVFTYFITLKIIGLLHALRSIELGELVVFTYFITLKIIGLK